MFSGLKLAQEHQQMAWDPIFYYGGADAMGPTVRTVLNDETEELMAKAGELEAKSYFGTWEYQALAAVKTEFESVLIGVLTLSPQ